MICSQLEQPEKSSYFEYYVFFHNFMCNQEVVKYGIHNPYRYNIIYIYYIIYITIMNHFISHYMVMNNLYKNVEN